MLFFALALGAISTVDSAARESNFRGVVRVERKGSILAEKGYGESPNTPFWVANISKSFTAALILRLRDLGKLRLEDRVGGSDINGVVKWFPEEKALIVVLSDVPEPDPKRPAPSRILGDLLESKLGLLH